MLPYFWSGRYLEMSLYHRLRWTDHISNLVKRVRGLMLCLMNDQKKLNKEQTNLLVTLQVLPVLYNATPVRLTPHLPHLSCEELIHSILEA